MSQQPIPAFCPICRCPGELVGPTEFVTEVQYLAVGDNDEIGRCPFCGVERCHAKIASIAIGPEGTSTLLNFTRADGTSLVVEQRLPALTVKERSGQIGNN